jgi:raffinose/stachyose/melibiose transport system substrate-binding protein
MGYQNIGPNYWKGEEGRVALIKGEQKLTDPEWVKPFEVIATWAPFMGEGYKAQSYPDSQNLFTLGRAAIYPAGSWEISVFNAQAQFKMGAFPPPVGKAGDTCYISDHNDIGIGLNAASKNADAAKTFLTWVASPEFAEIYANALPGFFSLNSKPVEMKDPLAQEFVSWRGKCKSTIRSTYQILSRGTPNLENETWVESANVINGTETPQQAAEKLQKGLDSWYKPAKYGTAWPSPEWVGAVPAPERRSKTKPGWKRDALAWPSISRSKPRSVRLACVPRNEEREGLALPWETVAKVTTKAILSAVGS